MIGHFPDPLPDEVLYSVCARYSDHVRYSNNEYIFRELFGDKSVTAVVDLPCHLGYLVNNLPGEHKYTVDLLIDRHTLLPFYSPFLAQEQLNRTREQMIKGSGRGIYRRTGITGFSVPRPRWLRYCPVCIETDRAEHGEAYWHRLHQAPGVEICPVHATFLENSTVRAQSSFTSRAFISAEQSLKTIAVPRTAIGSPFYQILMRLALDISYLLNHPITSLGSHFFRKQYFALLANHDFVTAGGLIRSTDLLRAFLDYYPQPLLVSLQCEIHQTYKKLSNWLTRLATVNHPLEYSKHPLHHLLLIHMLDSTIETFFQKRIDRPKLFGSGPWPCLNPTCNHYRKLHIPSCQIISREKYRPSGRFTCDCGFSYCRIGSDHSLEDVFRRDRVLSYGFVWETKLRELWLDPTVSLNEISRRLGVTNGTVYRQAARLELPVPRYSPWPIRKGKPLKRRAKDISWYRDQWLALLNEIPEAGVSILRRRLPSVYSWLWRYDQEWLVAHRPSSAPSKKPQQQLRLLPGQLKKALPQQDRINQDAQTADAIRATANRLINNPGPPKRVSLKRISQYVPQVIRLKHHLDKAVLTAQALQEVIETREAFALRRIWWRVECYRRENVLPTRSQLMHQASVYSIIDNPQVKQAIDAALEILSRPTSINNT